MAYFSRDMLFGMDTHPIPQNVTSFEFKLVGEMTLKQFIYLSVGMIIAYVFFVFLSETIPFIAWPVVVISASLGGAFAFLPIADRPLDHWVAAFFRAIYSPTKRVWVREGQSYSEDSEFNNRLNTYFQTISPPQAPTIQPAPKPRKAFVPLANTFRVEEVTSLPGGLPTKDELIQTVELAKQAQNIQLQIIQSERELSQFKTSTTDPVSSQTAINQILTNLQSLVSEASMIKNQLDKLTHTPIPRLKTKITTIVPVQAKPTQIVLTSTPNVISGFVTDTMNNYLDGVVVVIYDKQGLPVRALKTNKLGQFSGATPLPNGTYTMQLEKDALSFDVLQIELEGAVIPSIAISAKKLI